MKKHLTFTIIGGLIFIGSLVLYLLSFEHADYGSDGHDITFNEDFIYLIITGLIIFITGLCNLKHVKELTKGLTPTIIGIGLVGIVNLFGPLKDSVKILSKNSYSENVTSFWYHLGWGLAGLAVLGVAFYFFSKNAKKNKE